MGALVTGRGAQVTGWLLHRGGCIVGEVWEAARTLLTPWALRPVRTVAQAEGKNPAGFGAEVA